ncbi:MAG TPA: GNAT family N-acetyltransferase [Chloroflexota bacterium]|nr:GNAT family N-acetyltransferase [Chloroflexota bacterium]
MGRGQRRVRLEAEYVIREVRPTDLPLLEWYGTYSHLRNMEQANLEDVASGRKLWLVAVLGSFPIGHIKVNLCVEDRTRGNPRGYLFALRVFEPFQNLGIGTELIAAAEEQLRWRGYHFASIAVAITNDRARRLYERLGYRVYREEIGRWQYVDLRGQLQRVEEPEYLMDKPL